MSTSVINHVLGRLHAIGVSKIFGVAGDYTFPVDDAIVEHPGMEWIGCSNELNAAYAADGYARITGLGALCTTFGVGELSAISAIAGAYAERLPIFHLVGLPDTSQQEGHALIHHTLGDGNFEHFRRMADHVVCASAIMTPQNVAAETERLINAALFHRRPVYMGFAKDVADQALVSSATFFDLPGSDLGNVQAAAEAIVSALDHAATACILPGVLTARLGLRNELQRFVDASGLPFATMFMDKSVLEETQTSYVGMYVGRLMNEPVRNFVESCDCVLNVGAIMGDFSTGFATARLDPAKVIEIGHHRTKVGSRMFPNVELRDILKALTQQVKRRQSSMPLVAESFGPPIGQGDEEITSEALYPRWASFLRPDDVLVAEAGTCSAGLAFAPMPERVTFLNSCLWAAIGWATPAAFGASIAAPDRRLVLITGEGAHQLTAQEIGQFGRRGLKPIVFVLNNSGYLVERILCRNPEYVYNDLASWRYAELPHALGCDGWYTARVTTCGELDKAMEAAARGPAYVEVVTGKYDVPPFQKAVHELISSQNR
ncbi:MAG: alpha-keto acid decarboxylase family protein [Acidobacteriaceae bacterium]|nr:alpha-keto acid decarboxylase family protein [Acidobacteriaceae bacterium]